MLFKIFTTSILAALLAITNVYADDEDPTEGNGKPESPFVSLRHGVIVLPCVFVQLPDDEDGENIFPVELMMEQRGGSTKWEVVAAELVGEDITCTAEELTLPVTTYEKLKGNNGKKPDDENSECEPVNDNANNCHTKEPEDDDEIIEDDSPSDDENEVCEPVNENANNCQTKESDDEDDSEENESES